MYIKLQITSCRIERKRELKKENSVLHNWLCDRNIIAAKYSNVDKIKAYGGEERRVQDFGEKT
jgi:hypothetical protein